MALTMEATSASLPTMAVTMEATPASVPTIPPRLRSGDLEESPSLPLAPMSGVDVGSEGFESPPLAVADRVVVTRAERAFLYIFVAGMLLSKHGIGGPPNSRRENELLCGRLDNCIERSYLELYLLLLVAYILLARL